MNKAKHTPGPWHYDNEPHDPQIIASDGTHIATAHQYAETAPGVRHILKHVDAEANARLIASATELLVALEQMLNLNNLGAYEQSAAISAARAAIAKATNSAGPT